MYKPLGDRMGMDSVIDELKEALAAYIHRPTISLDSDLRDYSRSNRRGGSRYVQRKNVCPSATIRNDLIYLDIISGGEGVRQYGL